MYDFLFAILLCVFLASHYGQPPSSAPEVSTNSTVSAVSDTAPTTASAQSNSTRPTNPLKPFLPPAVHQPNSTNSTLKPVVPPVIHDDEHNSTNPISPVLPPALNPTKVPVLKPTTPKTNHIRTNFKRATTDGEKAICRHFAKIRQRVPAAYKIDCDGQV